MHVGGADIAGFFHNRQLTEVAQPGPVNAAESETAIRGQRVVGNPRVVEIGFADPDRTDINRSVVNTAAESAGVFIGDSIRGVLGNIRFDFVLTQIVIVNLIGHDQLAGVIPDPSPERRRAIAVLSGIKSAELPVRGKTVPFDRDSLEHDQTAVAGDTAAKGVRPSDRIVRVGINRRRNRVSGNDPLDQHDSFLRMENMLTKGIDILIHKRLRFQLIRQPSAGVIRNITEVNSAAAGNRVRRVRGSDTQSVVLDSHPFERNRILGSDIPFGVGRINAAAVEFHLAGRFPILVTGNRVAGNFRIHIESVGSIRLLMLPNTDFQIRAFDTDAAASPDDMNIGRSVVENLRSADSDLSAGRIDPRAVHVGEMFDIVVGDRCVVHEQLAAADPIPLKVDRTAVNIAEAAIRFFVMSQNVIVMNLIIFERKNAAVHLAVDRAPSNHNSIVAVDRRGSNPAADVEPLERDVDVGTGNFKDRSGAVPDNTDANRVIVRKRITCAVNLTVNIE